VSADRSVERDDAGGVVVGWAVIAALVWSVVVEMLSVFIGATLRPGMIMTCRFACST
jgi:hypothetical protein